MVGSLNTGKEGTRELALVVAGRALTLLERAREVAGVETEIDSRPLSDQTTTEEILEGTIGLLNAALEALSEV